MSFKKWFEHIPRHGNDDATRLQMPLDDVEVCDVSTSDYVPSMDNCRVIDVDVEGIVKVDYKRTDDETTVTEVMLLKPGGKVIRNVSKVYKTYDGSNDITAQIYNSSGSLVNGVKIRR